METHFGSLGLILALVPQEDVIELEGTVVVHSRNIFKAQGKCSFRQSACAFVLRFDFSKVLLSNGAEACSSSE